MTKLIYPPARKGDTVEDYHGTKVADPYRWLEDPDSPESRAWIEAENEVTYSYLAGIPEREAIKKRLTELWNFERYTVPFKRGGRYFYERNNGLQNQNVIYTLISLDAEPRVLLDPNMLSEDGTVALSSFSVSENGRLIAYGLSVAGSDWNEWKVRDVESGQDLPDHLRWVKFSGASWLVDGSGFYYSRFAEPKAGEELQGTNYFQKLHFHKIGTPQDDDPLIYESTVDPKMSFNGEVTEDGRYLMIYVWKGDPKNAYFYKDLADPNSQVVQLLNQFDARYGFVGNSGPIFYFRTNKDAPLNRLVAIDIENPDPSNWHEVIPEAKDKLNNVELVGGRFVAEYLTDAHSQIKVFSLDGTFEREVALPGIGTAYGFSGHRDDTETFYGFSSYTMPGTIFRYDIPKGESAVFRAPKIAFASGDYETKQVFYESKDGARVPMFLTHRKGLELNGSNPTYLSGYGGFNIPLTPGFNVGMAVWMERGGIQAVPGLRGGSEYGEAWHEAGMKEKKQNVFDDFIAAAEWLISNKYTSTPKLAIEGGSNGGLLVGACITQRPELFGAALPAVGVMDMLRFHKFTIGWAWVGEFGSADNLEDFPYIYAYSPLHNLKSGTCYPPTLITTADHDDRVVPAHSFKFAAAIQAAQSCDNPVLIRIETKAGHGAGKPVAKIIETATDRLAFLTKALQIH